MSEPAAPSYEPALSEPAAASYEAAMAELTSIVDALERDNVSVDELDARVRRARELVMFCRERLDATALAVRDVVDELASQADARPVPAPEGATSEAPF